FYSAACLAPTARSQWQPGGVAQAEMNTAPSALGTSLLRCVLLARVTEAAGLETRWAHRPEACVSSSAFGMFSGCSVAVCLLARGFNYGLALGAGGSFAGGSDG